MPFPVRSVQIDGGSEFRSLWTGALTVSAVSDALAKHQRWHNAERPPSALDYDSPLEHLAKLQNTPMAA